jgi:hypothetical protein
MYDETQPQLYEVISSPAVAIQRRPCSVSSLSPGESSFVLFDIVSRWAWVWSDGAGITCRNLAFSLAKETVRDEYKEWQGHICVVENREPISDEEKTFWKMLKGSPSSVQVGPQASATEVGRSPLQLHRLMVDKNDGDVITKLVAEANQFDGAILTANSDAALYLDAGGGELYLWLGPDIDESALKPSATSYARRQQHLQKGILTVMEPSKYASGSAALAAQKVVLWQQRFTQYGLMGASNPSSPPSPTGSSRACSPLNSSKRRPIIERTGVNGPCLFRVSRTSVRRLPLSASSLRSGHAILLVDYSLRVVTLWSGSSCGIFLKNRAKMIGQEISHDEMHQFKDSFFELRQGSNKADGGAPEQFWTALGVAGEPSEIGDEENEADSDDVVTLLELDGSTGWTSVSSARQFDLNLLLSKPSGIFLMDCGAGELYLYLGEDATREDSEDGRWQAEAYMATLDPSLQAVLTILNPEPGKGLGLEKCVMWHQRWTQFGSKTADQVGCGLGSSQMATTSPKSTVREVSGEVERMLTDNVGSLRMSVNIVDDAMSGHAMPLGLLEDDSVEVSAWRVVDPQGDTHSPGGRKNTPIFCEIDDSDVGVFVQGQAIALNITLKRGARRMLYLWLGDDVPHTHKAFLSLKATQLDPRADQINIEQGREPPFLCMLLARIGKPLVVLRRREPNPKLPRVFALEESSIFPGLGCVSVFEQDPQVVATHGLAPHRCYILVQPTKGVDLWPGSQASVELQESAVDIGRPWGRLVALCAESEGLGKLQLRAEMRETVMINLIASSCAYAGAVRDCGATATLSLFQGKPRPRRLFLVSHETRSTGAMFIRELGAGGVFTQKDLTATDSHVLDAGAACVYVWLGSAASAATHRLAEDVAIEYVKMLSTDNEHVAPLLTSLGKPRSVVLVRPGSEPGEFTWSFKDWHGHKNEKTNRFDKYGEPIRSPRALEVDENESPAKFLPFATSINSAAYDENGEPIAAKICKTSRFAASDARAAS